MTGSLTGGRSIAATSVTGQAPLVPLPPVYPPNPEDRRDQHLDADAFNPLFRKPLMTEHGVLRAVLSRMPVARMSYYRGLGNGLPLCLVAVAVRPRFMLAGTPETQSSRRFASL